MSSILVYTSSYPNILQPYRGFFVKEQIDAVKRYLNCSFAIVAPVESTKKREFEREEKDIYRPVYFYPPIPKVLIPFRGLMMLYASQPVLEGLFKQNRFDLVHIHFAYPGGFAISYLKKKFRVPVVLTVHGSDIFRYPKYPFLGWQIKRALKSADHIICVSSALREGVLRLVSRPGNSVSVIPNGINCLEWLDAPRGNEPKECCNFGNKLLYVGNLNYTKGVDILIRAITLLPEDRQVQLTIVGEGQMRSELEKLCVNLRLTDRIQFVGAVQHSEISQWMSRSNLLVIPSRSEGFGMVAVEAMASGLPVAATNIGGLREIITPETGVLADSVTPSDIALAILTALDKHWDRNIIRKSACKYDWSLVTRLIENIYSFVTKET